MQSAYHAETTTPYILIMTMSVPVDIIPSLVCVQLNLLTNLCVYIYFS
jgi:hypothetical protein